MSGWNMPQRIPLIHLSTSSTRLHAHKSQTSASSSSAKQLHSKPRVSFHDNVTYLRVLLVLQSVREVSSRSGYSPNLQCLPSSILSWILLRRFKLLSAIYHKHQYIDWEVRGWFMKGSRLMSMQVEDSWPGSIYILPDLRRIFHRSMGKSWKGISVSVMNCGIFDLKR